MHRQDNQSWHRVYLAVEYQIDFNPGQDLVATLYPGDQVGLAGDMASVMASGSGGLGQNAVNTNAVIDNHAYYHYLGVRPMG